MDWLLYGAYGYTGRLIARLAVEEGRAPILAGRDPQRTADLARELGLEHRSFALGARREVESAVADVDLVLNAAGPFSRTFDPMVRACLDGRCHYLDITGEIEVFEAAFALDDRARSVGVLVLPGVGFDVVPTDCIAVRAAARLTRPTHLDLAIHSSGGPSPGTAKSMLEGLARPGKIRRHGRIVDIAHGSLSRKIPFEVGERKALCIPWGDVSTAYRSTGISNVRVFMTMPEGASFWAGILSRLLRVPGVLGAASRLVEWTVSGPTEEERAEASARVWCEVRNGSGERIRLELLTPGGYAFTARSAVASVARVEEGGLEGAAIGFQTPATAFGADFVNGFPGVGWVRE